VLCEIECARWMQSTLALRRDQKHTENDQNISQFYYNKESKLYREALIHLKYLKLRESLKIK